MSKKVPIDDIPDEIGRSLDRLIAGVIEDADQHVKLKTPVGEKNGGTLRRNWQIVQGSTAGEEPLKPIAGGYSSAGRPRKANFSKPKWGKDYYLVNNMPYAPAIFTGKDLPPSWQGKNRSSVPPGWLPMMQKDIQRRVDIIARRESTKK